jgi:hypothetical protein
MAHTDQGEYLGTHESHPVLNHETTDVTLKGTTRLAVLTFVVIGVVMLLMYGLWGFLARHERALDQPPPPMAVKGYGSRVPPVPRLQSLPRDDLQRFRDAQTAALETYGWVDRNAGIVRLPIERAMDLVVERAATLADPSLATASAPPAVPQAPATPVPGTAPAGSSAQPQPVPTGKPGQGPGPH